MANCIFNDSGFVLKDSVDFKGNALICSFDYEVSAEVGYKSSEPFFGKFQSYFAQEAAGPWNKASVKAKAALDTKFQAYDVAFKKFRMRTVGRGEVTKEHLATIEAESTRYAKKIQAEMQSLILSQVGNDFVQKAHAAAHKRIKKEGTKLKPSKAKIAVKILKLVVTVVAVAAAAVATAASAGAAAPLLVAVAGWVAFSVAAAKKANQAAKNINSLYVSTKKHADQLEVKLAEIDAALVSTLKYATRLESEADSLDIQVADLKKLLVGIQARLKEVNPKGSQGANSKKLLADQAKLETQIEAAIKDTNAMRAYRPQLMKAFAEFRKVKNTAVWSTKISTTKSVLSPLKDFTKALAGVIKAVS